MGYIERLESYKEDMLRTLAESISYPSVSGEAVRTQDGEVLPFGKPVYDALQHMLAKGREMGFDTFNDDNYAGHIEFKAPEGGDEYFGVVGHIDVVPEGSGWTSDPYTMTERDGFLYGRGTSDDKGPIVACLYALKALKEEGLVPKTNIRLVLGCDEETGPISAHHYVDSCGAPVRGFTPDADFPLVNGELGIFVFDLACKFKGRPGKDDLRLTRMEGGLVHNAVPASCKAVIAGNKEQYDLILERARVYREETGRMLRAKKQGSSLVIEAEGKAAHGAHPELGVNAISIMMDFLGRTSFTSEELNEFIAFYNEHIGFDYHGERMGCDFEDEKSGRLIFNVGVVNINEEIATLSINIRFPVSSSDEEVLEALEGAVDNSRIGIITRMVQPAIYFETDDPMVATMLDIYREETGDHENPPITIPGGTYAKMVGNILAFGAQFPWDENTMHQVDEKLSIDSFMRMAKIYAKAIHALCCI